jgi:hypothetical protein
MGFFSAFPFAKVIYTILLVGLIAILARELYTVWGDHSLYVGNFQFFIDGKADDAQSRAFPSHISGSTNYCAQH